MALTKWNRIGISLVSISGVQQSNFHAKLQSFPGLDSCSSGSRGGGAVPQTPEDWYASHPFYSAEGVKYCFCTCWYFFKFKLLGSFLDPRNFSQPKFGATEDQSPAETVHNPDPCVRGARQMENNWVCTHGTKLNYISFFPLCWGGCPFLHPSIAALKFRLVMWRMRTGVVHSENQHLPDLSTLKTDLNTLQRTQAVRRALVMVSSRLPWNWS